MDTGSSMKTQRKAIDEQRARRAPTSGDAVIWPAGVEKRYGVGAVTRWRWERAGTLPKRDVHVGGRSGWRPETLAQFEKTGTAQSQAD